MSAQEPLNGWDEYRRVLEQEEEGRDAFFSQTLGSDPSYVVVRLEVDLRAEVRYAQRRVTVRIGVERLGTTSLTTRETILTS